MNTASRAAVDALVAAAPPLTAEQRDRLRALLRGVPRAEGPPPKRSAPSVGGAGTVGAAAKRDAGHGER